MDTLSSTDVETSLIEKDKKNIWHPFTQQKTALTPIPIVRGEGVYLYTPEGEAYLDGISSWWVNLHGHSHPYIAGKIAEQAHTLDHVIFADFTHPNAIDLAERLLKILPGNLSKIFYSDNGSTAVETALKMALQYFYNGEGEHTKRKKIISFQGGYHGDTFGAMSASGKTLFNKPFWPYLFEVETVIPPLPAQEAQSIEMFRKIVEKGDVAVFIFEPLILGVGGMKMFSPKALDELLRLCQAHGVITIADEVMTGFGRTGPLFACDYLTRCPDIVCLSKGISGGFLPLSVTACNEKIFKRFLSSDLHKALLHGHSYTANPIACAAALASLDLLEDERCSKQRQTIEKMHNEFVSKYKNHPRLVRCESLGTILALEYKTDETSGYFSDCRDRLYPFFLGRKILLRPLGNVVYVLPPYCITPLELETIYETIIFTLDNPV